MVHSMKTCSKCKDELPSTSEYFYTKGSVCKRCVSEQSKAYYRNNRDKVLSRVKTYAENNKEKVSEYHKQYYSENREELDRRNAEWIRRNPEGRKLIGRRHVRKARAITAGNIHEDWTEKELFETYGTDCYICNLPIDFDAPKRGIGSEHSSWPDHVIPTSRGGENTIRNVRPCHRKCNQHKHNKTYDEYISSVNSQEIVTQS